MPTPFTPTGPYRWLPAYNCRAAAGLVSAMVLLGVTSCARVIPDDDPAALLRIADEAYISKPVSVAAELARKGMEKFPDRKSQWYWRFRTVLEQSLREKDQTIVKEELPAELANSEIGLLRLIDRSVAGRDAGACEGAQKTALAKGWKDSLVLAEICVALVHLQQNELDAAERVLLNAESSARSRNNNRELSSILSNRAYLFLQAYRNHEVDPVAQEALARSEGDRRRQARILTNLGYSWYTLGDFDRARDYLSKAETILREMEHFRTLRITLQDSARLMLRSEPKRALALFEQSLQYMKPDAPTEVLANFQSQLALFALAAGDTNRARSAAAQAWKLEAQSGGKARERNASLDFVRAKLGDTPKSEFERLAAGKDIDREIRLDSMLELARQSRANGSAGATIAAFERIIRFGEEERGMIRSVDHRIPFTNNLMPAFNEYVDYLVSLGRDEEALAVADSSRALVFSDRTAFRSHKAKIPVLQRALAGKNAVAVSFWLTPQRSYAWAISAKAIHRVDLPSEAEIRASVTAFRAYLVSASDTPLDQSPEAKDLAVKLQPVCGLIAGAERIVAVLDGPLHGIGIDTLMCGGHAVIEKASVEIAPSLWLLNQRTTEWKSGRAALLVGDAIEVVPEFPALAGAADELTSIASLLGNPPAKVIRGGDANPQTIRSMPLDAYGVIHFAAHANANRLNPLESAIVLSKSREGDYQLFARQILEQKLSNPLVTLSACRSAGARSFSGEGFVGLTWAFLQAGAQGVVAGLWAVDDAASQKLMDDFYTRLRDGKPPLMALTEAKRKHLSGGAPLHKPYYWAGWQYFTSSL